MSIRVQIQYWAIVFIVLAGLLWLFSGILLPFLLGAAIAYMSDPLADKLEKAGLSRLMATILMSILLFSILGLVFVLLVPPFIDQLIQFLDNVPRYADSLQTYLQEASQKYLSSGTTPQDVTAQAFERLKSNSEQISLGLLRGTITSTTAILGGLGVFFVTPVVAFYFLLDWDKLISHIDALLPRQYAATIRVLAAEADHVLASFVRGQLVVCLILGAFYAIALTAIGLKFGLFVGLFAGFLSFIPFVGSTVGLLLSVGLAISQYWPEYGWVLAVAGIFIFGQLVEGNILSPKIVGNSVHLHPVWLIFALAAFGSLLGFTGLLIAVPVAAVIGVLVRYVLGRYMLSSLYTGREDPCPRLITQPLLPTGASPQPPASNNPNNGD